MFINTTSSPAARSLSIPACNVSRNSPTSIPRTASIVPVSQITRVGFKGRTSRSRRSAALFAVWRASARLTTLTRADENLPASAEARRAGQAKPAPPAASPRVEAPPSAAMTTSRPPASALAVFVSGGSYA